MARPSRKIVMTVIIWVIVALVGLKLFVRWLEPRMAFYPSQGVQETPGAVGLPFTDVNIRTADGETLYGWWLENPKARAQVIFWHGNGGNLSLWIDVIAGLRQHGFSVLAVDYRGYGASTGAPTERGLYRDADACVAEFMARFRRPGQPVLFWGRSLGSPVAAYAASQRPPDALVMESPYPDVRSILKGNPVLWTLSFFSSYRFPAAQFLQRYEGPLLVIHGDRDSIVPFTAGRALFDAAPTRRKTFVTIPGADHNDLNVADPALYWKSIDTWLDTLGK